MPMLITNYIIRNNPIHCKGVDHIQYLEFLTDCDTLRPTKDHRTTTTMSPMTEQYLFHNQMQPFYMNSFEMLSFNLETCIESEEVIFYCTAL